MRVSGAQAALRVLAGVAVVCSAGACARIRPPAGVRSVDHALTVTAYCPCGKCCSWHRTWYGRPVHSAGPNKGQRKQVGLTASGTQARRGTIAADTSRYPFGTIMFVPGYGYGRVEDRGAAIKGETIDVFFRSHSDALEWGRQRLQVRVWPLR